MGYRYSADELDRIIDWACGIADGPVTTRRAIRMWEARQDALRLLRRQDRDARACLYPSGRPDSNVIPLGRHA